MNPATDEIFDHHRGNQPLLRPTSPWRQWIFLSLSFTVFLAVNAFLQYLGTGQWFDFHLAAYRRDLALPLGEMFLQPLSVFEYPWMVLILGLLLSLIIFVPTIVSVLYRLEIAGAFVAVVAFLGHAPVLALVLALGCVLAARTHLRSDLPFLATMLGLLPAALYFCVLGFQGSSSSTALPLQRLVLNAPFVLAIVVAVLSTALVLWLARLTGFRPGVVWPVLVLLLAGPAVLFYARIGPDQLDYNLIARPLAPADAVFEPVWLDAWAKRNNAEGLTSQTLRVRLQDDLQRQQRDLGKQCERFLKRHPASPPGPAVAWIRAQCQSLWIHEPSLDMGFVKYDASHPLPASRESWRRLVTAYGGSPQSALACWRLGVLEIQDNNIAEGVKWLRAARERLQAIVAVAPAAEKPEQHEEVFSATTSLPDSAYYAHTLHEVECLLWHIQQNAVSENPRNAQAFAHYLRLNPNENRYAANLMELAAQYEDTRFADNLKLAVAQATINPYTRAQMLLAIAEDDRGDAAVEANYHLGWLAIKTPIPGLKKPADYFKLVADAPANPWQKFAREQLRHLATQPAK